MWDAIFKVISFILPLIMKRINISDDLKEYFNQWMLQVQKEMGTNKLRKQEEKSIKKLRKQWQEISKK